MHTGLEKIESEYIMTEFEFFGELSPLRSFQKCANQTKIVNRLLLLWENKK